MKRREEQVGYVGRCWVWFFFVQGFGGRKKKVRERNISGNIVMSSENYKIMTCGGREAGASNTNLHAELSMRYTRRRHSYKTEPSVALVASSKDLIVLDICLDAPHLSTKDLIGAVLFVDALAGSLLSTSLLLMSWSLPLRLSFSEIDCCYESSWLHLTAESQ